MRVERFREGKVQVLVATDVMSRGIDVSGIDAVVNFDVPMDPEDYVHRIGRTGRAGATGHAYTFVAPDEISPLREIEYFTKKLVPVWDLPGFSYDAGRIVPQERRFFTQKQNIRRKRRRSDQKSVSLRLRPDPSPRVQPVRRGWLRCPNRTPSSPREARLWRS